MKSICVFCGSNPGSLPEYKAAANKLGKYFAENQIRLIYGGANVGLMKATAEAILDNGGEAIGVITHFLARKHLAQPNLSQLIIVDTMHQRKAKMAELCEGFIVLPGGVGTLEELFEIFTLGQLGLHSKPIGVLNINHYYDLLLEFLDSMVKAQMLLAPHREMLLMSDQIPELVQKMNLYTPPVVGKWIDEIRMKS